MLTIFCLFRCMTSTLTIMSVEQDLVKGKDTLMPLVDFQEKKRTGSRQLKISPSGVVQYLSHTCYKLLTTLESDLFAILIQVILVGHCRWCLCSAFNTKVTAWYSCCCGKHYNRFKLFLLQNNNYISWVILGIIFRLVVFILACFLKFSMILEILAPWTIWLIAYFRCSESTLSRTCIMLK